MKQYKGLVQKNNTELILPISDGQSFIFSFSASAYKKAQNVGIRLYVNDQGCSILNLNTNIASKGINTRIGDVVVRVDDKNVVFKVDKTFGPFKTYINDQYVDCCPGIPKGGENRVHAAGVAIDSPHAVAITLAVFEYAEYEQVEAFAQAMRNSDPTDFKTEDEESQALEKREKALSADGADRVDSSSVSDTVSADANWMRVSSTVAWPTAVELVAGDSIMNTVKATHDRLMCAWVVQRGGNTSLSTCDFFAHSHGAAWPAAVAGYKFDKILKRVQERHERLMMLVPLAKAEGSS